MAQKADVPEDIRAQGWIDLDDVVQGVMPLDRPERFDGEQSREVAAIYFSSGNIFRSFHVYTWSSADIVTGNAASLGTTGLSKAVALTHYSHVAFLVQSGACWPWYVYGRDVIMAVVPLYHVFGGLILTLHAYYVGCPLVVLPRFEPDTFLASIPRFRITVSSLDTLARTKESSTKPTAPHSLFLSHRRFSSFSLNIPTSINMTSRVSSGCTLEQHLCQLPL